MKTRSIFLFSLFAIVAFGLSTTFLTVRSRAAATEPLNPTGEATVSISFDGLMALCFGNPNRVSVGILDVVHHKPEIKITKIKGSQRSSVAVLSGEQLRGLLKFDIEGGSSLPVSRYYGQSMADDPNDFRWNIDLEGDLFQRELHIKEEKLFGKIHFSSGLFYADNLSERPVRFFSAGGQALPFNRRIAEPAGKISLNSGEKLVIQGPATQLRLDAEPGVSYEIAITNLPPADMASMDHFLFYFDFINERLTPFTPVMVKGAAYNPRPLICQSVVFSRSRLD